MRECGRERETKYWLHVEYVRNGETKLYVVNNDGNPFNSSQLPIQK